MKRKLLVTYSMASTHVQTTRDYLWAIKQHAPYDVFYLHVTHAARPGIDLDAYDIILQSYCVRLAFDDYVSEHYKAALRRSRALKVVAVQDEYDAVDKTKSAIKDLGFQIVLTCVPKDGLSYVYPASEFPGVEFVQVLTGYVPDEADQDMPDVKPLAERPIPLGYRGRDIGAAYGRLGFDKYEIGRRMREACLARGMRHDIAMDEASRIYSPAWLEFVGNCRAMLGSESGSNVFDFDGAIRAKYAQLTRDNGGRRPTYQEFAPHIAGVEGRIEMGQVSPRVFECAIMRTPMVLLRGRYSGVIEPDEHYIPIEYDYSNLDAVLDRIGDVAALQSMADRAYSHLVLSGKFSYRAFVQRLVSVFERQLELSKTEAQTVRPAVVPGGPPLDNDVLTEFPTEWPRLAHERDTRQRHIDQRSLGSVLGKIYGALYKHSPMSVKIGVAQLIRGGLAPDARHAPSFSHRTAARVLERVPASVREQLKARVGSVDYVEPPRSKRP